MKTVTKIILGASALLLVIVIAGTVVFLYGLKDTIHESLRQTDMSSEFIRTADKDIEIDENEVPGLDAIPKDSVKLAVANGRVLKLKDSSVIARDDSGLVAIKNGGVKKLKDNGEIELIDGSKLELENNNGEITLQDSSGKISPLRMEFRDTAVVTMSDSAAQAFRRKTITSYRDSVIAAYQDSLVAAKLDSVEKENKKHEWKLKGKKISIAITGVDSRIGVGMKHADANHVMNIYLETGTVEIISVPRGTKADAGFGDTTNNDYLANVRSNKGRRAYLKELSRISRVKHIKYYLEFGFSQAIGLLELMGYKENAVQMLRMLRSRKAFGSGDHQRSYNQGQFIRQMLLHIFPGLDDLQAEFIFRSGLLLVETNLNVRILKEIRSRLKSKGFPHGPEDVIVRARPRYGHDYIDYDFTDDISRGSLYNMVSKTAEKLGLDEKPHDNEDAEALALQKLDRILSAARKDTLRNPAMVIKKLKVAFEQKAWFQLSDKKLRARYRDEICYVLSNAYRKLKKYSEARNIEKSLAEEIKYFREK